MRLRSQLPLLLLALSCPDLTHAHTEPREIVLVATDENVICAFGPANANDESSADAERAGASTAPRLLTLDLGDLFAPTEADLGYRGILPSGSLGEEDRARVVDVVGALARCMR